MSASAHPATDEKPAFASRPRQPRYSETVIIGTGFSGLLAAIGLQKKHCNDFVLLERNAELGGTWQANSYPGAEVDVPSSLYCVSFIPYPFRKSFASQSELLAYTNHIIDRFGLRKHARTTQTVTSLAFDERAFLWQGDVRLFLAIVKYVEDKINVEQDAVRGVPGFIVVEDNVGYYSTFLPVIYTELTKHQQQVTWEGANLSQKVLRMRARPKILLCSSFEEAASCFDKYRDAVLGVVSDIEFPRGGELCATAGIELARLIRESRPDVSISLHSSYPANERLAESVGASFLLKNSPVLLEQLRRVMTDQFCFGDFVFRLPDGRRSLAWRLTFQADDRTLTDEEITTTQMAGSPANPSSSYRSGSGGVPGPPALQRRRRPSLRLRLAQHRNHAPAGQVQRLDQVLEPLRRPALLPPAAARMDHHRPGRVARCGWRLGDDGDVLPPQLVEVPLRHVLRP